MLKLAVHSLPESRPATPWSLFKSLDARPRLPSDDNALLTTMSIVRPIHLVVIGTTVAMIAACSSSEGPSRDAARTPPSRSVATSGSPSTGPLGNRPIMLRSGGLGPVRFGIGKARVTAKLTRLLGPPTGEGTNPGCGPAFTEIHWSELAVEFHQNVFSGYRDINRPEGRTELAPDSTADPVVPKAQTAAGIRLGDSLGHVRTAYSKLSLAGANRWHTSSGLNFVDNGMRSPASNQASIIEIRVGTCGSY